MNLQQIDWRGVYLSCMDEVVKRKLEEIKKKAKEGGIEGKPTLRNASSLHQIIRTKEQADLFMDLLKLV